MRLMRSLCRPAQLIIQVAEKSPRAVSITISFAISFGDRRMPVAAAEVRIVPPRAEINSAYFSLTAA